MKKTTYAKLLIFLVISIAVGRNSYPTNQDRENYLRAPDPFYYNLNRAKLLHTPANKVRTVPIRWVMAAVRENAPIYRKRDFTKLTFKTKFLQRFVVLDKFGEILQVRELDKKKGRIGWVNMRDMIYLPRALKDTRTSVHQKVVFTHLEDKLVPGKIGDVTFYKSPGASHKLETRAIGTLRIAYVYDWQKNSYDDSEYVLVGNYPYVEGYFMDERAFEKTVYGWCRTSRVFPWNSRIALIPNEQKKIPPYIFRNGPTLIEFYEGGNSRPNPIDLLTSDSKSMWKLSGWPFFLEGKLKLGNGEFLRLVCQVGAQFVGISGLNLGELNKEIEFLKSNIKNLDVVFLIDATKSMDDYIEAVAAIVQNVMKQLENNSNINSERLRIGAAVYRDYVDGPKKFEIEPLTRDISIIKNRLSNWAFNAHSNADDKGDAAYPEALFNGIAESVEYSGFRRYNAKYLIVIGDAGNHSRGRDTYTRASIGKFLGEQRVNCIMVKVNHPSAGGEAEVEAMRLFRKDAVGIRDSYIQYYIEMGSKFDYNHYTAENVVKFFKIDEVDQPSMLEERLMEQYSRQISSTVDRMLDDYQRLTEGSSIVPQRIEEVKNGVSPFPKGYRSLINPIVFDSLRERFKADFPAILEELRQKRAYIMQLGYAKEFDPQNNKTPQFKNVYLFRKGELGQMHQVLTRTLNRLNSGVLKNLWQEMVESVYGEKYEPRKTFNDYVKMHDGITYKNLSALFNKTQEEVSRLTPREFEEIIRKISSVKIRLENLLNDEKNERYFGPFDDPYIWLNEDEMP